MPTYAVAVAIVDNSFFAVAQAGNSSKHEIGMWAQPSVINQTRYRALRLLMLPSVTDN